MDREQLRQAISGLIEQLGLPKIRDTVWDVPYGRPRNVVVVGYSFGLNDECFSQTLEYVVLYVQDKQNGETRRLTTSQWFRTREEAEEVSKARRV